MAKIRDVAEVQEDGGLRSKDGGYIYWSPGNGNEIVLDGAFELPELRAIIDHIKATRARIAAALEETR